MADSKPVLLIVDDDEGVRNLLAMMLFRENYHIEFAVDGQEGYDRAVALRPTAILLDVMMPKISGYEVCRRLRAHPDLAEVPIVMLTANYDHEMLVEGLSAGADEFLAKPFDNTELSLRLRTITRLDRYRRLLAERARFQWMLDSTEHGYALLEEDDTIFYANARARTLLNLPGPAAGQNFLQLVAGLYRREPEDIWRQWRAAANQPLYLVQPETDNSRPFWLQVELLPRFEAGDDKMLIRIRDVSYSMANYQDVRKFHTAVSHKLRTPISTAEAGVDLLAQHADQFTPEDVSSFAKAALRGIKRLRAAIDDIMKYIESPALAPAGERLSVQALIEKIKVIGQEVGLTELSITAPDDLKEILLVISAAAVDAICWEVLENSIKFHPERKPRVEVSVRRESETSVEVLMVDNGVTLTPQQIEWAWLPYLQGEKYFTGESPGMGLGLPLVATLMWRIGGRVHLANRADGPGVAISLFVPLA